MVNRLQQVGKSMTEELVHGRLLMTLSQNKSIKFYQINSLNLELFTR